MDQVLNSYEADTFSQQLLLTLATTTDNTGPYTLQSGILRYKGHVWVGSCEALQIQIISALHDSPVGGHSGFPVTYQRIKQLLAWKNIKPMIKSYVAACTVCQQSKPNRHKYPRLLQPLPIPEAAWQIISLDFIEVLPRSAHALANHKSSDNPGGKHNFFTSPALATQI